MTSFNYSFIFNRYQCAITLLLGIGCLHLWLKAAPRDKAPGGERGTQLDADRLIVPAFSTGHYCLLENCFFINGLTK